MSLSVPNNQQSVKDSTSPVLLSVSLGNKVNQLHGIAGNNQIGAGIPKQVSNVRVSVANANTGSTCAITVLYNRDPTDTSFSGVNIWVKGYQGNSQLVQVASGTSSPCTFALNNTGETVSFTVQAFGNGGNAPLTQAPTNSGVLPKSTAGGFGISTVTSTPPGTGVAGELAKWATDSSLTNTDLTGDVTTSGGTVTTLAKIDGKTVSASSPAAGSVLIYNGTAWVPSTPFTANPAWWNSGDGSTYAWSSINAQVGVNGAGSHNLIKWWFIRIPYVIVVSKISLFINTGVAAVVGGFGVYSHDGTTKYFTWDSINLGSSSSFQTTTLGSPVTLLPGIYACAASSSSDTSPTSEGGYATANTSESSKPWNANGTARTGLSSNVLVAGVMPATLGTMSVSNFIANLPCFTMEP